MTNAEKYKTAEERYGAFYKYCSKRETEKCCGCLCTRCQFEWLDLEAEEDNPLPCPFCGGKVEILKTFTVENVISCTNCRYLSREYPTRDEAIAAHNRYAKAVADAKKEVK